MGIVEMNDNVGIFPSRTTWGEIYGKYRAKLVSSLSSRYCLADREDAVENAFDKLMNKKDPAAYGDKMPASAEAWAKVLYWQARSFLSHMNERSQIHAKCVEKMAKELEEAFVPANQGAFLDAEVHSRALPLALEIFRKDQDVSCRNLKIYLSSVYKKIPAKVIAEKFKISEDNVYVIKFRVGKLLEKHGKKYFQAALKKAA
jgi:hypothetical protein